MNEGRDPRVGEKAKEEVGKRSATIEAAKGVREKKAKPVRIFLRLTPGFGR
jgi:hypothetical protein